MENEKSRVQPGTFAKWFFLPDFLYGRFFSHVPSLAYQVKLWNTETMKYLWQIVWGFELAWS